jgi:glutamine synthetase
VRATATLRSAEFLLKIFSWGVGNRGVSIRVGGDTEKEGKGYLEDRRPSSNMDPYVVCGMLAYTTLVWKPEEK